MSDADEVIKVAVDALTFTFIDEETDELVWREDLMHGEMADARRVPYWEQATRVVRALGEAGWLRPTKAKRGHP